MEQKSRLKGKAFWKFLFEYKDINDVCELTGFKQAAARAFLKRNDLLPPNHVKGKRIRYAGDDWNIVLNGYREYSQGLIL